MLRTKFRGNQSAGSGEEDCLKGFSIYGHGGHIDYLTSIISTQLISMSLKAYIQNLVNKWPNGF